MARYFVRVLRPLFILTPAGSMRAGDILTMLGLVVGAATGTALIASALVNRLEPAELLREE